VNIDGNYNNDVTADSGSIGYAAETLTWNGPLAIGATVLISYSASVDVAASDTAVLTNTVVSSAVGSNCVSGSADPSCTTSISIAARTISLTGLTSSFTLSGLPNTTVTAEGATTMTVITNSVAGFGVTVRASTALLPGAIPGNTDTIPVSNLKVRDSGTSTFTALSNTLPFRVHNQTIPTGLDGFAVSNDYQIDIPFVRPDSYSTTLEYIVSAN
jgi:large repetitive protein